MPYPKKRSTKGIYKWKFEDLISIDFRIKKVKITDHNEGWYLFSVYTNNKEDIFKYDNINNIHKVIIPKKIAEKYIDNSIVEFIFDKNKKRFVPYRPRPDKDKPNFINVALEIMDSIINPITINDLLNEGEDELVSLIKSMNLY